MEVKRKILGLDAYEVRESVYEVRLVNGKRIEIEKDPEYNRITWQYRVGNQYFDSFHVAYRYVRELIREKLTGVRYIYHCKREVPGICGIHGKACRHPKSCNTALCYECPVAEAFFAERDGVHLEYVVE